MMVVPPSGILISFTILATVPILQRSLGSGSSILASFCARTPISLSNLYASFTALMLLSRPTVMGNTTPGNKTVLRNGKMGSVSGITIFLSCSLSFSLIGMMGIKSVSSSDLKYNFSFTMFLFLGQNVTKSILPSVKISL